MINLMILLIGDLLVAMFQGFYMGVGIRQSAGLKNIIAMTVPTLLLWLILGYAFGIYTDIPTIEDRAKVVPKDESNRSGVKGLRRSIRNVGYLIQEAVESQKIFGLLVVWLATSLFAVLYQTWYWNAVLKADRMISMTFTFYFALVGIYLLVFWRIAWTLFVALRVVARKLLWIRVLCYLGACALLLFQIPAVMLTVRFAPQRYTLETVLEENIELPGRTAIVFGAGVYGNGTPSGVLRDRIKTAVLLYQNGKVDRLLMSGDNSDVSRNEVDVMARVALENGIPESAILRDNDGISTLRTCHNAAVDFGITEAALVTQQFHTTRSLYACEQFGMKAVSVAADMASYNIFGWVLWNVRDWMGLTLSWLHFH